MACENNSRTQLHEERYNTKTKCEKDRVGQSQVNAENVKDTTKKKEKMREKMKIFAVV